MILNLISSEGSLSSTAIFFKKIKPLSWLALENNMSHFYLCLLLSGVVGTSKKQNNPASLVSMITHKSNPVTWLKILTMLNCSVQSQMKLKPGSATEEKDGDKFKTSKYLTLTRRIYEPESIWPQFEELWKIVLVFSSIRRNKNKTHNKPWYMHETYLNSWIYK